MGLWINSLFVHQVFIVCSLGVKMAWECLPQWIVSPLCNSCPHLLMKVCRKSGFCFQEVFGISGMLTLFSLTQPGPKLSWLFPLANIRERWSIPCLAYFLHPRHIRREQGEIGKFKVPKSGAILFIPIFIFLGRYHPFLRVGNETTYKTEETLVNPYWRRASNCIMLDFWDPCDSPKVNSLSPT